MFIIILFKRNCFKNRNIIALHILSRKHYENPTIQFPFKFSLMDKISCKLYIRTYIINILTFTLLLVILLSLKRKKVFQDKTKFEWLSLYVTSDSRTHCTLDTINVEWFLDSIDQREGARKYVRIKRSVYSMATWKLGFKRDNDISLKWENLLLKICPFSCCTFIVCTTYMGLMIWCSE